MCGGSCLKGEKSSQRIDYDKGRRQLNEGSGLGGCESTPSSNLVLRNAKILGCTDLRTG